MARLAHLPKAVIHLAKEKSEKFESFLVEGGGGGSTSGGPTGGLDKELVVACELLALMEGSCDVVSVRELWKQWSL